MAKIHVRGGSRLRLKFLDDSGKSIKDCQLTLVGSGPWYDVRRTPKPKVGREFLQAVKEPGSSTVFRACGDSIKGIEIGYRDTRRPVSTRRLVSKRR